MSAPTKKTRWTEESKLRERELIAIMSDPDSTEGELASARDELVTIHIPLVEYLARRFRDRGESEEDLRQVGMVGLIKAVDRFDPSMGNEFSTFATPTIVGEIKRYFRDHGWSVRVPRRLQEMRMKISRTSEEISQLKGRSPTVAELAEAIGVPEEQIIEGLESAQAYSTSSLDSPTSRGDGDDGLVLLGDSIGSEDSELARLEFHESLKPLLDKMDDRQRSIVVMRFFKNMTQAQIAEEVGVSQMHVSRLLASALGELREGLGEDNY